MSELDTWGRWAHHAKSRHMIKLCDGRVAELIAVHRPTRTCKVRMYGRHYYCWIEDVAQVAPHTSAEIFTIVQAGGTVEYADVEPWRIIEINESKHQLRSTKAAPSKSWLEVDRTRLHSTTS